MIILFYIKSIINWIIDLFLPQKCLGCQISGKSICSNCKLSIRKAERETDQNIIAVYDYRDPLIKKAIWHLKYYKHSHIGKLLGQMLYESLLEEISDISIFTIKLKSLLEASVNLAKKVY